MGKILFFFLTFVFFILAIIAVANNPELQKPFIPLMEKFEEVFSTVNDKENYNSGIVPVTEEIDKLTAPKVTPTYNPSSRNP